MKELLFDMKKNCKKGLVRRSTIITTAKILTTLVNKVDLVVNANL